MTLATSAASPAGLSLKQRQEAIRRAMAEERDPSSVKPVSGTPPYQGRLLEGYNSRKLDEVTWAKIAFHLAAGVPIIKIAEYYRLSRSTIWRALSQSPNLRRRVAEERAMLRREADSRFVAMREIVVDTLYRAVADGNIRATLWMADRLGLGLELLQQAEKPPRPGYARIPQSWFPTPEKAAAIIADLDAPPDTPRPLPVMEESPPIEPRRNPVAGRLDAAWGNGQPAEMQVEAMELHPEPGPFDNLLPDPVPHLHPVDADPMGDGTPPHPDAPPALRLRPRARVKASSPPIPRDRGARAVDHLPRRGPPRPATRLLAWILHNRLPVADGVDNAPGLSAARWVSRARWLSWGDKPMDLKG